MYQSTICLVSGIPQLFAPLVQNYLADQATTCSLIGQFLVCLTDLVLLRGQHATCQMTFHNLQPAPPCWNMVTRRPCHFSLKCGIVQRSGTYTRVWYAGAYYTIVMLINFLLNMNVNDEEHDRQLTCSYHSHTGRFQMAKFDQYSIFFFFQW